MQKHLGKITKVEFGFGGYQETMFGLNLIFETTMGVVQWFEGTWGYEIPYTENCKWTEEERTKIYVDLIKKINETLLLAKKEHISQLKGVPVEVMIDANTRTMKSWRILDEVL